MSDSDCNHRHLDNGRHRKQVICAKCKARITRRVRLDAL